MSKRKGPGQKGTFGDLRLGVSKQYVLPFSRNRTLFLGGAVVVGVVSFVVYNFLAQEAGFISNGPLSSNHANLEGDCSACHTQFSAVTDDKCSACHEKYGDELGVYTFASHYLYRSNDFQRVAPREDEVSCFSCHTEHEGREVEITAVADTLCLSCHPYGSFNQDHPQFEFATEKADGSVKQEEETLKFPHIHHVREVMKSQSLVDIEVACLYCHNAGQDGKSFQPIDFDRHCDACHLTTATQTPFLPIRQPGVPGVETLESLQSNRRPGTLWTFYTNPNEFRTRRQTVRKSPLYHKDPWITENLRGLRQMLYPDVGLADLLRATSDVPSYDLKVLYDEAVGVLENQALELRAEPVLQKELRQIDDLLERVRVELRDPYAPLDETKFLLDLESPSSSLSPEESAAVYQVVDDLTGACQDCHFLDSATIRRVRKDQGALRRAEFDHRAHILQRRCLDCHVEIPFQELVSGSDPVAEAVDRATIQNLPTIETCQECHNAQTVSNRCVTCHFFHPNKSQRSHLLLYLE